ncbi:snRNA-activating protein complex subunit 1 [Anaeramoeba flamelloides]|uniref:snRNA-activating protein complex subunit 1 n=1 Tax=Anaeramoeba flamelloides TaxID=1746091 RepID=A0ABQ8XUS8_9EUKA|nr:snRNA-activating protein complex subunit 1 [Anaeramoeba flamelloides]
MTNSNPRLEHVLAIKGLIQEFVNSTTMDFSVFKKIWSKKQISTSCPTKYQRHIRPEDFFQVVCGVALGYFQNSGSLESRAGALYTLFLLYNTQQYSPLKKIEVSPSIWEYILAFYSQVVKQSLKDPFVIFRKMTNDKLWLFCGHEHRFLDRGGSHLSTYGRVGLVKRKKTRRSQKNKEKEEQKMMVNDGIVIDSEVLSRINLSGIGDTQAIKDTLERYNIIRNNIVEKEPLLTEYDRVLDKNVDLIKEIESINTTLLQLEKQLKQNQGNYDEDDEEEGDDDDDDDDDDGFIDFLDN